MRSPRAPQLHRPDDPGHGLQLAWLAGGIVVVEYLFAYPGIGSALVDAVSNRDIPVIQAITPAHRRRLRVHQSGCGHPDDPGQPAAQDGAAMSDDHGSHELSRPPRSRSRTSRRGGAEWASTALATWRRGAPRSASRSVARDRGRRRGRSVRGAVLADRVRRLAVRAAVGRRLARHRQPRPRRADARAVRRLDGPHPVRRRDRSSGWCLGTRLGVIAAPTRAWVRRGDHAAVDVLLAFPTHRLRAAARVDRRTRSCGSSWWPWASATRPASRAWHAAPTLDIVRERLREGRRRLSACRRWRILLGEILPNIASPLLVEIGLRITYSIGHHRRAELPRVRPAAAGSPTGAS